MTKAEFIALLQSQDWQRWFDPAALRGGAELAGAVGCTIAPTPLWHAVSADDE